MSQDTKPSKSDLNLSEAIFFGILLYLLFLGALILIHRCIITRLLCPVSGWILHGARRCCSKCPTCGLEQSPRSVFCCTKRHSVYDSVNMPKLKFRCFLPNCRQVQCFCCELFYEDEKSEIPIELTIVKEMVVKE